MLLNIGITRASCTYNLLFVNPTVNECMAIIFQSIPHHTPAQASHKKQTLFFAWILVVDRKSQTI